MKRTAVKNSNIQSVGYDPESCTLEVEYKSGSIYQYQDVPQRAYDGLLRAESKGRYLNASIKAKYPYKRLEFVQPGPLNKGQDSILADLSDIAEYLVGLSDDGSLAPAAVLFCDQL